MPACRIKCRYQDELVRSLCSAIESQEDDLSEWQDSREEVQTGRLQAAIYWWGHTLISSFIIPSAMADANVTEFPLSMQA